MENIILPGISDAFSFHFQVMYSTLQVKCKSRAALFCVDIEDPTVSVVPGRVFPFLMSRMSLSYNAQHPDSLCSVAAILLITTSGLETPFATLI